MDVAHPVVAEPHADLARADARPDQIRKPLRCPLGMLEEMPLGLLVRRNLHEVALLVGDQDARVTHVLELLGHHPAQVFDVVIGSKTLHQVVDELAGQLHRRVDLDLDTAARVVDGEGNGEQHGDDADDRYGDHQLPSDREIVPPLAMHVTEIRTD